MSCELDTCMSMVTILSFTMAFLIRIFLNIGVDKESYTIIPVCQWLRTQGNVPSTWALL